jgi:hypothetical protein
MYCKSELLTYSIDVDRVWHHAWVRSVCGLPVHRLPRPEHPVAMDVGINVNPSIHRHVSGLLVSGKSSLVSIRTDGLGVPGTNSSVLGTWRREDGQKPSRLRLDFDRTKSRLLATCTTQPSCSKSKQASARASRFGKSSSVSGAIAAQRRAHFSSCSCNRSVPSRSYTTPPPSILTSFSSVVST